MNTMQIKVVSVEVTNRGKFDQAEVTYKNLTFDGKVEAKKVMSFVNKDVFSTLKSANNGDVFTISREKDDKGYWQWTGIAAGDSQPASTGGSVPAAAKQTSAATPAPKSTYETAEERAKKQVYIVRQSSVSAAITHLNHVKKSYALEDIITVAKELEAYVFGLELEAKPEKLAEFDEDEDIPM